MAHQKVTFLHSTGSKGEMLGMLRELVKATQLMEAEADRLTRLLEQACPMAKAA
ncbi:hypothetical protein [Ralstonia soli]|uniref:Uncharacterized protein n=1 Tax=Ralstonia soli TaxID=2953896 RepID=A0ABT1AJ73_9RALS|nr:hypothetical protein [Ralstonia soli]MCO5398328.1 hypothetical protein [Ralstonia soli]